MKFSQVISLLLFFVSGVPFISISQSNYHVSGTINGCKGEKVVLSKIYGKEIIAIDSITLSLDCSFRFTFPDSNYTGVFSISVKGEKTDFIFNKEEIVLTSNPGHPGKLSILKSVENKPWFYFHERTSSLNDTLEQLMAKGKTLYEKDPKANAIDLKNIAKQVGVFQNKKSMLADSLVSAFPLLFVSKMMKASVLPDFKSYMKNKDAAPYPNEAAFLGEHFFDNIDFADSNLLHTGIIFDMIGKYFQNFVNPPSTDTYKKAIDFILIRTYANKNVNDYVMNTMMKTFNHSDWEDVYTYLIDKYLTQNTCSDDAKAKRLAEKSKTIKTLKPGNKAPGIKTMDLQGKTVNLDSIHATYTLVIFWASWCEFCEKAMPSLENLYSAYKPKGLEILAVALDSVKQNWIDASGRFNIPWLNTCDLKGFESPVLKEYNIWRTPTFFLLDKEKKIIAKPVNTNVLKENLDELKW